jgi:hypothetical protein
MLCVTLGFHWGLLQSAAWVGMLVKYSQEGSFRDAVSKTFDGQHPCPLCKLVSAGKKSEKKPEAQLDLQKFDLFAAQTAAFRFPPATRAEFSFILLTSTRGDAPPRPPPRPFFG